MADKQYGLLISALVAMVAIVGLVVLLKGGATGGVTVIRGETGLSFERNLGSRGEGLLGDKLPCYYDADGNMVCPDVKPSTATFGPPPEWRRGNEPTVIQTASGRGYWSS